MVYVVDAQYGARGTSLVSNRNILFTAITRSRAWVRISGYGPGMKLIAAEVQEARENDFDLRFKLPTADELGLMRRIHRDRPLTSNRTAKRVAENLLDVLEQLDRGELEVSDLPEDVRKRLLDKLAD